MSIDLVLRNATIVTHTGQVCGDIGIERGKIVKIGEVEEKARTERDCTDLFILPGAIDMHVHFRDPGFPQKEDFESGSRAAVAGGITTVVDMPNTDPPTTTLQALQKKRKSVAQKSFAHYGLYMGFTGDNFDEIKNAENIAGVKVYTAPSTGGLFIEDVHQIERLFELGRLVVVHAEDPRIIRENEALYGKTKDPAMHSIIRSPESSYEAVRAILHCAKKCNGRVHITHVSSAAEVEELTKFKGPLVSSDVTPHHLFLSSGEYSRLKNFAKVNPPLRTPKDCEALLGGLREEVIQAVATDHAPHTKEEKKLPFDRAPSGVPGVETMLPLLLDAVNHGEFSLGDIAAFTSKNPAQILGIKNKGAIQVGFDADLVVVDMKLEKVVGEHGYLSRCGWSPFEGRKLRGWPIMTIVSGEIVYGNGVFKEQFRGQEVQFG